jgi:predicted ATP-grasp superfamily ATP-dependent carboligase
MPIPVVALNLGHSTLGIGRCLAGTNAQVHVLAANRWGIGAGSRHLRIYRAPDCAEQNGELLRDRLLEFAVGLGTRPHLFPTRDVDVVFIDRHRAELECHYRIHQPAGDRLDAIINKTRLIAAAAEYGIPVPRTLSFLAHETQPARLPGDLTYPVIVKPVYAHTLISLNVAASEKVRKAAIALSENEALEALSHLLTAGADAYLQEFISGDADRLAICAGYLSEEGGSAAYTARKVFQYPPEAGIGFAVETVDRPQLKQHTLAFLEHIGCHGFFEAEFKEDASGTPYLIEVNPRHWDQHAIGRFSGVNVTRLALGEWPETSAADSSGRTEAIRPALWCDDAMLLRLFLSFDANTREILARLWSASRQGVVSPSIGAVSDPLPAVISFASVVSGAAAGAVRRLNGALRFGLGRRELRES